MDRTPEHFPNIVQDTIIIGVFLVVGTSVMQEKFLTTSAVGAVVIGFALQDTLGNTFAGLAIQVEKPFRVDHWVRIGSLEGTGGGHHVAGHAARHQERRRGDRAEQHRVEGADEKVLLKLTLVQAMRHESIVAGLAQITLIGIKDDVPARFSVGELLGKPRAELPFSFRYFQTIEQTVVLPEGFEPFETYVRVQSSKLRGPVQQTFAWKVAGQQVAAL